MKTQAFMEQKSRAFKQNTRLKRFFNQHQQSFRWGFNLIQKGFLFFQVPNEIWKRVKNSSFLVKFDGWKNIILNNVIYYFDVKYRIYYWIRCLTRHKNHVLSIVHIVQCLIREKYMSIIYRPFSDELIYSS